ncbi:carboxyl transferase domain-containing protein [Saccharomonospora sp. NPDC006951]
MWLNSFLDKGTVSPLHPPGSSGIRTARGCLGDTDVVVYCTVPELKGGALGHEGCDRIVDAIGIAARSGCPVIGIWHSGGARLDEGIEALDGVGRVFTAMTHASGRIPQISIVLGPAAGGAAYGPALTDLVITAPEARVFVTGPDVITAVTGERVDQNTLGGPDAHSERSGVVHIAATSQADAFHRARRLIDILATPRRPFALPSPTGNDLSRLLPTDSRRAYDVKPLVEGILDHESFEEIQGRWAPNIVVGLGRLAGRSLGVIANNPLRKGGCIDARAAEKAARFVRMCDAFGVPLLVLADVPGYLPGTGQEWDGVVRRGAKLLHAFAESVVPRITLVLRRSYGGAYLAMNAAALGATAVFAWPGAEIEVMGAGAAVRILHRRRIEAVPVPERPALEVKLAKQHELRSTGTRHALELGVVDRVIDPHETRYILAREFAAAPSGRGSHNNIPL